MPLSAQQDAVADNVMPKDGQDPSIDSAATQTPEAPASPPPQTTGSKIGNYFKKRFDKSERIGSAIILLNICRDYILARGAMTRVVDGKKEPDRIRNVNSLANIGVSLWSFSSSRGGKPPKGNTVFQRLISVCRHPGQHSPEFEFVLNFPNLLLGIGNNFRKGLKAYGVGLAPGESVNTAEKVRVYEGIALIVATLFSANGLFAKKTKKPQESEKTSTSPKPKGVFRKIWKENRALVIGSGIHIAIPAFAVVEGLKKRNTSKGEASHILISAGISVVSLAATSFYTFQRLVKGNAQQKSDVGAKEQPNITGKEAPSSDLGEETQAGHGANQLMTAFTQKTIMPKTAKSLLQPRLPTSFAQKVSPPSEPEGLEEFLYRPIHIPTL